MASHLINQFLENQFEFSNFQTLLSVLSQNLKTYGENIIWSDMIIINP